MAFEAFESKRKSQLRQLTRRRRIIDGLNIDEITQSEIDIERAELLRIQKAHEDIINSMMEQPEYQIDENSTRLDEQVDQFRDAYDEFQGKLNQLQKQIPSTSSTRIADVAVAPVIVNNLTLQQKINRLNVIFNRFNNANEDINREEAVGQSLGQLQAIFSNISKIKQQFDLQFDQLCAELAVEDQTEWFTKDRKIQNDFFATSAWVHEAIETKSNLRISQSTTSTCGLSARIKLPPIDLPKFNGSPESWIPFRDLFAAMVHDNTQLSGSQKYRYLKTSIIDKLSPIKFDTETDAGYDEAWKKILAFYDDKRKIVDSHFNAILNMKKMATESSDELQKLVNDVTSNIEALQRLLRQEEMFDAMTAHLVSQRLDGHTRDLWESENNDEIPNWATMKKFLEKRRKTLNALAPNKTLSKAIQLNEMKPKVHHINASEPFESKCPLCCDSHRLMHCSKFLDWDVTQRHQFVKEKKLCYNCMGKHHGKKCSSNRRCRTCNQNHHSLLHFNNPKATSQGQHSANLSSDVPPFVPYQMTRTTNDGASTSHTATSMEVVNTSSTKRQTLLSTVAVYINDDEGNAQMCRALLDSGSDSNFMTSKCADKLGLKLVNTCLTLTGISEKASIIRHKTTATINSYYGPFEKRLSFSVMPKITGNLPTQHIEANNFQIPTKFSLADPKFNESSPVDLLLNAEVFYDSLLGEKCRLAEGPMLIHTKFGWILGGEIQYITPQTCSALLSCFSQSKIDNQLKSIENALGKLCEAEEVTSLKPVWTAEEKYCEETFAATTTKDETGKFVTLMPMKQDVKSLGKNLSNAMRQFHALETRRNKDKLYNQLYVDAMNDFIKTNHMSEVKPEDCAHYLPHHGVLKMSSTSTKLRPVFNASSVTETGKSLNDVLCVGPTIQPESIDIITRFREKKYVITGDITKMYRQIWIHPAQRKFLSVLWRQTPDKPIKHYQINVVTFGTACAPFLAIRVLQQIAEENSAAFPEAANIIKNSFYVDDLMFGIDTIQDGIKLRDQIRSMLSQAGMNLGKITANHPSLLKGLQAEITEVSNETNIIKALGILYDVKNDEFSYQMKPLKEETSTKLSVLSLIAGIYDPIGWLGPVILHAKLFMKKLWQEKLEWKDPLPEKLLEEWDEFRKNLSAINDVKIQRRCLIENHVKVELHGFCDASIKGYGAVIYAVSFDQEQQSQISILCSKSRVAPKNQKTLARLELCAATLLAKMINRYAAMLSVEISDVILWSDSTIVLNWIAMAPNKLQTFVGNRVAAIQECTHMFIWRHIRGEVNPADVLSRGLMPHELQNCNIWWKGPTFLNFPKTQWPESIISVNEHDPEVACEVKKTLTVTTSETLFTFIEVKRNSAKKIQNIFVYVLRFVNNCRRTKIDRQTGQITIDELQDAENQIIKIVQKTIYPQEYQILQQQRDNQQMQQVSTKSSIIALTPFMDKHGVIRVRGRIEATPDLTYDQKHQIILPSCNYSNGIIRDLHAKHLHPTKSTLMVLAFQRYWIIKAKNIIKKVQRECLICFKMKPRTANQLMSDLPEARVKLTTPFVKTAVDYAGYYMIKTRTNRNAMSTKAYVAVFKCMCTGAIHLEAVSDLSAQAFVAALDRFTSRRGLCTEMFSDNATCFKGADNSLKKIVHEMEPEVKHFCASKSIKWNFTTPRSPSAGGIYESGVKLMKHHMTRLFKTSFNFEQFTTILCKIEAIVNSRPLTPMSNDPADFHVLTPGHFLIGRPLASLPQPYCENLSQSRLKHWEGLQQIQQIFWRNWHQDYLRQLQTRPVKFREIQRFNLGDMVLLKEDNLPPMKWSLGRIIQLFPGKDKVVRNVKIKTEYGDQQRNVRQICPLPFQENIEETSSEARECVPKNEIENSRKSN